MTGREIIKRVLEFDNPPRIGYNFITPGFSDIAGCGFGAVTGEDYGEWGRHPELLAEVPGFPGEVCRRSGNIYGRLGRRTNGECIRGALEGGWDNLDGYIETYIGPYRDQKNYALDNLAQWAANNRGMFTMAPLISLQSLARDTRTIGNMLADTALEPENLKRFVGECAGAAIAQVDMLHGCNIDSAVMYDDWGLQNALYISPDSWRGIWKGAYERVVARLHGHGMKFMLHSCGCVRDIIGDFVEIGVDAFQFDQPALYDFDWFAAQIGGRAALWSPVDIQKVLPTGDKAKIQAEAARMIKAFHKGGGLIAKDYPSLADIGVEDGWAQYARDVFIGAE